MKKTLLSLVLLSSSLACVPASEPLPPAGAGGLQTDPSPAARGEAFVSRDGWIVTIDKLIVRAGPQVASEVPDRFGFTGYSSSQPAIFNGKEPGVQIYTPEIPPGPAKIAVAYNQYSIYIGADFKPYDDYADVFGSVTAADAARFTQVADQGFEVSEYNYGYVRGDGPSVLIELHASKDRREVKLKAAVATLYSGIGFDDEEGSFGGGVGGGDKRNPDAGVDDDEGDKTPDPIAPSPKRPSVSGISIEIRANALALARLEIAPEKVFTGPSGIDINRLIEADQNKDGEITGPELAAIPVPVTDFGNRSPGTKPTLLDLFADKLTRQLLTAHAL